MPLSIRDLKPAATFKETIAIPIVGRDPAELEFEFLYITHDELDALLKEGLNDHQLVERVLRGWDLTDAFTPENLAVVLNQHMGAPLALWRGYLSALRGVRSKN